MGYVAAFRAYSWDADQAALAARFFAACPSGRHVVLMNEEHGPVAVPRYEVVGHGADFSAQGLPDYPAGRSMWFNGDYAYTHLRRALPGYEHYLIVESDVAVNLSLEPMMRDVAASATDAVLHQLRRCLPSWRWFQAAQAQTDPHTAGLFALVLSGAALDLLHRERQALARRFSAGDLADWPIVESFVVTTLRNAGMRIREFEEYAETERLRVGPALSLRDPDANRPGALVHPVLGSHALAGRALSAHLPGEFFRPGSALQRELENETLASVAPALWSAFLHRADHHGLAHLRAAMQQDGVPVPQGPDLAPDLAWGKPARVSSTCEWSQHDDPEREAAGANGLALHDNCAFHTGNETDAWWMVDLLDESSVGRVEILNRVDIPGRFRHFVIESSNADAAAPDQIWTERYSKTDDAPVSGDDAHPFVARFVEPFRCRCLRIRRLGPAGFLHLRRVRVFAAAASDAAARPAALLADALHG